MARLAQAQARTCKFKHQIDRRVRHGQNLYATSKVYNSRTDPAHFLIRWAMERHADHRRIRRTPRTGSQVGTGIYDHYSAMIWSSTTKVGCAYATNCRGKWKTIVVCNYSKPGNVRRLGWYKKGKTCSKCPTGYRGCDKGLCTRR